MDVASLAIMIPIVAIIGGITVAIVSVISRARLRELEIKERIAMIERGLVPAPEADPRGFDRAMLLLARHSVGAAARHRRAGVTLMGVGFGLMVLIAFAGERPSSALGVGGFLVVVGLAFFINGLIERRTEMRDSGAAAAGPSTSTTPQPPRPD